MTDTKEKIEALLRDVRDAGALDDNMGAEDWTHSDKIITQATQSLLDIVNEARADEARIWNKHWDDVSWKMHRLANLQQLKQQKGKDNE